LSIVFSKLLASVVEPEIQPSDPPSPNKLKPPLIDTVPPIGCSPGRSLSTRHRCC
jgi:hypothetical protein